MRAVPRESMRKDIMTKRSNGKRRRRLTVLFLLAFGMLTGCGFRQEPVEITFIHGFGTSEATHVAMRQIYQDFEKKHPAIKLHIISMPSSQDVVEKVENMLAVGKVPDVIFTAGEGKDTIYEYMIAHEKAVDLMPYLEADEAFYENVSPMILDTWKTEQGELYTVSDVLFMVGYWYNCSLFEQAGIQKSLSQAGLWYATYPEEEIRALMMREPGLLRDWDDEYGDRMQKIVFIGQNMDKEGIIRELDNCLG